MTLLPYSILIAFICAAMNHMGLIAAAERVLHCRLPVLNCPKCSAFWMTLGFWLIGNPVGKPMNIMAIQAVSVAFLAAYMAVWMELAMGGIDKLYMMLYGKIYPTAAGAADNAPAAGKCKDTCTGGGGCSDDAVPEVRNINS